MDKLKIHQLKQDQLITYLENELATAKFENQNIKKALGGDQIIKDQAIAQIIQQFKLRAT